MLIFDLKVIGNTLYKFRNKKILSRAEVAEKAGLSDRAYADIERGSVNMRVETMLKICKALEITPNDIFVEKKSGPIDEEEVVRMLHTVSPKEKITALELLQVYIESLK